MKKLLAISALAFTACAPGPSAQKCDQNFANFQSQKVSAFTVGTTTRAQIEAALGSPTTYYEVLDGSTPAPYSALGTRTAYLITESGQINPSASAPFSFGCGYYMFSFDTSNTLKTLTWTAGPQTVTYAAEEAHKQY